MPTVYSKGKHLLLRLVVYVGVLNADGQAQVATLWRWSRRGRASTQRHSTALHFKAVATDRGREVRTAFLELRRLASALRSMRAFARARAKPKTK